MLKKIFACGAALIFMSGVATANLILSPVVSITERPADITVTLEPGFETGFCTGTYISPNIIMTAGHCLTDDTDEVAVTIDGKIHVGEVLVDDDLNDFALLKTTDSIDSFLSLACGVTPKLGDKVTMSGYPLDLGRVSVEGRVSGLMVADPDAMSLWPNGNIIVDMVGAPGMSGSAISNEEGKVIALFVGGYGNGISPVGLAVSIQPVCDALQDYDG